MIKQLSIYLISFGLVSFLGYYLHTQFLSQIAEESPISLVDLYIFFGTFSLLLCGLFLALLKTARFRDQLGFLYLVSVALKIALFCIVFYRHIFSQDSFTNTESANLLIPMGLMLILEVLFMGKLLNKITPVKNAE